VAAPATSRRIVATPADGAGGGGGGSRGVDCGGDGSHQEEVRLHYRSFLK